MEYRPEKGEIILHRELNELDLFVLEFCSFLKEYVIVSGYVSILLGRSRATEDVDLLIPRLKKSDFHTLWETVQVNGFECLNTSKEQEAWEMLEEHAIRFARKGHPLPNMEFKMIKRPLDQYAFDNKIAVRTEKAILFISPLEMQIAYKLFLGSEKDIEDARHLYRLFKEKLNKEELLDACMKLEVVDKQELLA